MSRPIRQSLHRFEAVRYLMEHPKRLPGQRCGSDSRGRVYLWDDKLGHERALQPTAKGGHFYVDELDRLVEKCLAEGSAQ